MHIGLWCGVAVALLALWLFDLIYYIFGIPHAQDRSLDHFGADRFLGDFLYIVALVLAPLRLIFEIIPELAYLAKSLISKSPRGESYGSAVISHVFESISLILVSELLLKAMHPGTAWAGVAYVVVIAGLIQTIPENGTKLYSLVWQSLPHRHIAEHMRRRSEESSFHRALQRIFIRYCDYYSMSDEDRAAAVMLALKKRSERDPAFTDKLRYVSGFRLVARSQSLRFGLVREVATGKILIDNSMTNDPWLLIGLAIRRSPWIFDPRYLRRPFYYRTESAPLTTRLVLQHLRYCPPFAVYQFGHAVRDGKHTVFHAILHLLGVHIEEPVSEDGTYDFHRMSRLLKSVRKDTPTVSRPLWTDPEVMLDLEQRMRWGEEICIQEIAEKYMYPIAYVEEVLAERIGRIANRNGIVGNGEA